MDSTDESNFTPLHHAAFHTQLECVKLLADKGGNVNAQASRAITPLMLCVGAPDVLSNRLSLTRAQESPSVLAIRCLVEKGASLDAAQTKDGRTALHEAVYCKSLTALKALLDLQADANLSDLQGNTPLHLALDFDEAISLLVDNCDMNLTNNEG